MANRRRRFLSRACSWRLREAKKSQAQNNPSSQVETHGYLSLETGAWDRRIVAPTFFAFFRLSVALNRTSSTDQSNRVPTSEHQPPWCTPAHRTGRDPQSTNTRDCRREKSKSTAVCSVHRARRLQLPEGKTSSFCISARSHSLLLAPSLTRRGWWARTPIRRESKAMKTLGKRLQRGQHVHYTRICI
jgi:hypothetical protein